MAQNLRREVLKAFKSLHKTRKVVFNGDSRALVAARLKINEEYKKCSQVKDEGAIEELVAYSNSVKEELEKNVIQAVEEKPGSYTLRMREEVVKLDNVPFDDCANLPKGKSKTKCKR